MTDNRCLWKHRELNTTDGVGLPVPDVPTSPILKLLLDENIQTGPDSIMQAVMKHYKKKQEIPDQITVSGTKEKIAIRLLKPEGDEAIIGHKVKDTQLLSSKFIGTLRCTAITE